MTWNGADAPLGTLGKVLDVSFRSAPQIPGAFDAMFSPEHLQRLAATFEFSIVGAAPHRGVMSRT